MGPKGESASELAKKKKHARLIEEKETASRKEVRWSLTPEGGLGIARPKNFWIINKIENKKIEEYLGLNVCTGIRRQEVIDKDAPNGRGIRDEF